MPIKIYSDRIEIGNYTLFESGGGIEFTGNVRAENFKEQGHFQGDSYSYLAGGYSAGAGTTNFIDSFNIPSESDLIRNTAILATSISGGSGQSSETHGYTSGGNLGPPGNTSAIQKFLFATDSNASNIANLTAANGRPQGHSSTTHGYASGGAVPTPPPSTNVNTIQKFPFATDANSSNIGSLGITNPAKGGHSSPSSGYTSGGNPTITRIDRFPFATDTNAIEVGQLTQGRYNIAGCSSDTHGYAAHGSYPGRSTIDKFSFAFNSNAVLVGQMPDGRNAGTGTSGRSFGYVVGFGPVSRTIRKFSFVTDANGTGFGTMGFYRGSGPSEGQQV